MIRALLIFLVCCLSVSYAFAHSNGDAITIDLAQDHVDITTGFNGARLHLFGEVTQNGQVVITVKGPKKDMVVRQKSRIGGVWMNSDSMRFENVPQFYDFAMSDAESDVLDSAKRRALGIGFSYLKFDPKDDDVSEDKRKRFQNALLREKQSEKLFPIEPERIVFLSDHFFRAEFYVPSNVPTGQYMIDTFFIRDGDIVEQKKTSVKVAQIGFAAGVKLFASSYSFAYAILIILIAVVAGWLSNAVRLEN